MRLFEEQESNEFFGHRDGFSSSAGRTSKALSDVEPLRRCPKALYLDFRVRVARTEEQLARAVDLRNQAYGRHYPDGTRRMQIDELSDRAPNSLVLVAERKSDSGPIGTIRVETGTLEPHPIEGLLPMDERFSESTIAYLSRLAIPPGPDSALIKAALIKALHRYCFAVQIDWLIVAAVPPLDRQYLRIGFSDVYPDARPRPMPVNPAIMVRALAMNVTDAERNAKTLRHPMYDFLFRTYCPDIDVFGSVSGVWTRPRLRAAA